MAAWTSDDQDWAALLNEHLPLLDGEQVEHYVVAVSVGSGIPDGKLRRVLVSTCCRETNQPTHLINHAIELLTGKN